MALNLIRLELARSPGFPEGSSRHGYEFVAPVTADGHIDTGEWRRVKDRCTVLRFWGDEEEQKGRLRHVGHGWKFDYDVHETSDDEPFFKLDRHKIEPGTYVSVTEQDGVQRPFRIVQVSPIH